MASLYRPCATSDTDWDIGSDNVVSDIHTMLREWICVSAADPKQVAALLRRLDTGLRIEHGISDDGEPEVNYVSIIAYVP